MTTQEHRHQDKVLDYLKPAIDNGGYMVLNLSNEAIWEFQGKTGWEGEYNDFPIYEVFGREWVPETYIIFEKVLKERGLDRNQFTLIMNDWGIEKQGLKANYYLSQREWVINQIAQRLEISPKNVQLDIGIQFNDGWHPVEIKITNEGINGYFPREKNNK